MKKEEIKLPKKLSDLIVVALEDMEKCEKNSDYKLDMTWAFHERRGPVCSVCFAGAVMAQTLGADINASAVGTHDFGQHNKVRLVALDNIREGQFLNALAKINIEKNDDVELLEDQITSHEEDPKKFKEEMLFASGILAAVGL